MRNTYNAENAKEAAERNKNALIILVNALNEVARTKPPINNNPQIEPANTPNREAVETVTIIEDPPLQNTEVVPKNTTCNNEVRTYSHATRTERKYFSNVATNRSVEEAKLANGEPPRRPRKKSFRGGNALSHSEEIQQMMTIS